MSSEVFIEANETVVDINEDVITIEVNSAIPSLSAVGGVDTDIQYNDEGVMNGSDEIQITANGPVIRRITLSSTTNYLVIYASDGTTPLFLLDANGNLFIKGSVGQL